MSASRSTSVNLPKRVCPQPTMAGFILESWLTIGCFLQIGLAQVSLENLAVGVAGQGIDPEITLRAAVVRQARARMILDGALLYARSGRAHQDSRHHLAPLRVGQANDGCFANPGQFKEDFFDFPCIDVRSAADDHV